MSKRNRQNKSESDSDAEEEYICGSDLFSRGYYRNAINFFTASIEKGIKITDCELLIVRSMLIIGQFDEAEQLLNQIESDDVSLMHQVDSLKVTLYIAKGSYQRAFAILDGLMDNNTLYANYWSHAYLANILGETQTLRLPLPDAFRPRPQLSNSPKQTNLAQINLALMDYKSVDYNRTSTNIGDYIQTVAVMRHIARHLPDNALIDGDANSNWQIDSKALRASFTALRESWSENERRNITSSGKIVVADRDATWNLTAPQKNNAPIWYPVFGSSGYKPFGIIPVIPLPSQYLPIFFSFHLQDPEDLTESYIAYLKRFAPIGCFDITTRDLLMNQGIDAFFSGCVTTTLALADKIDPSDEILDVDAKMKPSAIQIENKYIAVKACSFDENITESLLLLRRFRNARKVITSRLYCYLPTRALGGDARFIHKNKADKRFDGLIDIDDDTFDNMRYGLTDLLDKILGKIMAGDSSADEIYAYWRELTMPLVEQSRRERKQYKVFFVKENTPLAKSDIKPETPRKQAIKEVPIALAFDKNIADYVPALINSIEANTSCATRYIMLMRDVPDDKIKPIEKACKQAPIQWFEMGKFLQDTKLNLYSHLTVSCMDRLFLPELLPDIDKILYLDIDITVQGDVAELYQTELVDAPLAAKRDSYPAWMNKNPLIISKFWHLLPKDKLLNFQKSASVSFNMLNPHFNSGVLVLSLEKMRQDNFTEQAIQLATEYQLDDQTVLNFYTADNYIELSPIWSGFPNLESLFNNQRKLLHWAGRGKPWDTDKNVFCKHIWQKYADMD